MVSGIVCGTVDVGERLALEPEARWTLPRNACRNRVSRIDLWAGRVPQDGKQGDRDYEVGEWSREWSIARKVGQVGTAQDDI